MIWNGRLLVHAHAMELSFGCATLVARWRASEEERKAALEPLRAERIVEEVLHKPGRGRFDLIDAWEALEGDRPHDAYRIESSYFIERVLDAVSEGKLILVPGWHGFHSYAGAPRPKADTRSPERRVADEVMGRTRGKELSFEGSSYVILPAVAWPELRESPGCSLEVVRREVAQATISRMAARATSSDEREGLEQAATMLADTNAPRVKGGLFLLQRRVVRTFSSDEPEPAIAPAMYKRLLEEGSRHSEFHPGGTRMEEYEKPMRQIRVPKLGPPVPIVTPIAVELFVQVLYPPVEAGGYFERPMESLSCVLKSGGREFPAQTNIDGTMYVALPAYPGEKLLDFGELGTVDLGHSQRRPFYDLSAELEQWSESYFVAGRMGAPEPAPAPRAPPPPIQLPPAAPPAVQPPVPLEPLPPTSGVARILARFITLAELAGTRAVVALVLLWPSKLADKWIDEINPQTGKPYASKEEYDAVWNQRGADKNANNHYAPTAQQAPSTRRNPGQTCDDERLDELQSVKERICENIPGAPYNKNPRIRPRMPCSLARARVQAFRSCIEARWRIQDECFGSLPDAEHADQLEQLGRGLEKAIELEQTNCAPGHPMAEK